MKNILSLLCLMSFITSFVSLSAQETVEKSKLTQIDYEKRSPIYDYNESQLNNIDSIPDFDKTPNKLKLTGTIYESDGVTPAKDVILYIYHANTEGDYIVYTEKNKRSVYHRGWIKTDADGKYTFFTFMPGSAIEPITYPRRRSPKQILPVIKENGKSEYNLNAFVFDDDPLLTKSCRKRIKRKGIDNILKLENKIDGIYVVTKNIVLNKNTPTL